MRWTIAIALAAFSATTAFGQDPDLVSQWFKIPEDQAALAVYLNWNDKAPMFSVSDSNSKELDKVDWQVALPLVRQYRVKPGTYEIHLNGSTDPKKVELKPGELAYLRLDEVAGTDQFKAVYETGSAEPTRSEAAEVLTSLSFKADSKRIQPVNLDLIGNQLYFNTEPPFEIPKPDEPEPQPEPKPAE